MQRNRTVLAVVMSILISVAALMPVSVAFAVDRSGGATILEGKGLGIGSVSPVSFADVHIDDEFWSGRIETNRTVSIPYAFGKCEENGRMDNFRIAGGLKEGQHRGGYTAGTAEIKTETQTVKIEQKYGTERDRFNKVIFETVRTDALRLEVQLPEKFSAGIHEWRVK